jgi:ligand-binding sensor domain-containing protein/two-component sensor histidine kinase
VCKRLIQVFFSIFNTHHECLKNNITILFTKFLPLIPAALLCFQLQAQHKPYFIQSTETTGLSDNRVTCFFKDKKGYLWIGTENGLNRFDGINYILYRPSSNKKKHLSNAFITSVAQDAKENIWVSTTRGLNRIDAATDTTEIFLPDNKKEANSLPTDLIWDVYPANDTSVWIATDAKPFVKYNPVTHRFFYYDFKQYLLNNKIEFTQRYHAVFKIQPVSATELLLGTTDGIFSFNTTTGSFRMVYGTALDNITLFHYNQLTKQLYCADEHSMLYVYNVTTGKTTGIPTGALLHQNKPFLPYAIPSNAILVPSPDGLALLSSSNEIISYASGKGGVLPFLSNNQISTVYKDRNNITWIGTSNGVASFVPQLNSHLHVSFPSDLKYDAEFPVQNFLFQQLKKAWLVVSFRDNKLWAVNNSTGEKKELIRPILYQRDTCFALYSRHPDSIYFLCKGSLLTWFPKSNQWNKINLDSQKSIAITCMDIDGDGNYWIGTKRRGLLVYNPSTKKIWLPDSKTFNPNIIPALKYDPKNNYMWIATHNSGLHKYSFAEKKFIRIRRYDDSPTAMHSSLINGLALDNRNNIWCATAEGGLAKYNIAQAPEKGVTNYERESGLPENNVNSVTVDGQDNTYFSTAKGIGFISADGKLKLFYNNGNGLPYSKFQLALLHLPGNLLATAVENSLFCFDTKAMLLSQNEKIIINQIQLNDSVNIALQQTPSFRHYQNTIRFDFVLPDFVAPAAIDYYYKLEGYEKEWIANGKLKTVRYSSLPPGTYTFYVKAKKGNGEFNSEPVGWKFMIRAPFWKTTWFQLMTLAIASLMVAILVRQRIKSLKAKALLQQQYTELEVKALRNQMNPHFIFNSLNSISTLVAASHNEKSLEYLGKFSKLLRLVLDESEDNYVTLKDEVKLLDLYLQMEQLRFGESFKYTITIEKEIDQDDTLLPSFIIHPLAENAIWHGLLHKHGERKLIIAFTKKGDSILQCVVKDNGIGMEAAKKMKGQRLNGVLQKSKGLQLVKDRLRILGKQTGLHTSFIIEDAKDSNGLVNGTKVTVEIPVKYE